MGNTISAQKTQLVAALAAAGVSIDANSLVYTVQMADGAAVGPALSDNARNALIISVCTGVPLMAAVVGYAAYYARKRGHTCAPCATKVKVSWDGSSGSGWWRFWAPVHVGCTGIASAPLLAA